MPSAPTPRDSSVPDAGAYVPFWPDPLPPAPPAGRLDRLVDRVAGPPTAIVAAALAGLRRARAFHPRGHGFDVELTVEGDPRLSSILGEPGIHHGVARISRGLGMPEPLVDALGIAVRLPLHGGEQDLFWLSSHPSVAGRRVFLPAQGYGSAFWSSVEPLSAGGPAVLLGLRPVWSTDDGQARVLPRASDVAEATAAGELHFELLAADPSGPWRSIGALRLLDGLPTAQVDELRFSPFHRGGGLEPVGPVNAVRRLAYAASQWAGGPR